MVEIGYRQMTSALKKLGLKRSVFVSIRQNHGFETIPAYKSIKKYEKMGKLLGIETPFFRASEGSVGSMCLIEGKEYLNFAWCDYLGLNQHPSLHKASQIATEQYGTCVSASRLVAGETNLHRELETEISDFLGVDAALLFVSGHAANVSTISTMMSDGDLIVHDEFVHNSAMLGSRLSGAATRSFPHNDYEALTAILRQTRSQFRNVLIIVEGLYSTEGDVPDLAALIEVKDQFGAWLMVDDAHGLGILGNTGRGCAEHCGVDARQVDIWMGTLSKTLASCGGYIAGSKTLIEVLRHTAPGFVYSVGLPPAMTAAALASLRILRTEPERVERLRTNGQLFLAEARAAGLNTGKSNGLGMLPVIAGDVIATVKLWHKVFARSVNPSLIVYPGVPMKGGRLRFFLTSEHTPEQVRFAVRITSTCMFGRVLPDEDQKLAATA
jgi:8-amino-7-oxononanoate synthase